MASVDLTSILGTAVAAGPVRRRLAALSAVVRDGAAEPHHPLGGRGVRDAPRLTASMTDAVLIDLAVQVDPGIEVVFIDTGYHFPETLDTVEVCAAATGSTCGS